MALQLVHARLLFALDVQEVHARVFASCNYKIQVSFTCVFISHRSLVQLQCSRLWRHFWPPLSVVWLAILSKQLPLKCADVSLYSVVKQRLKCNTGKVCNCSIQVLFTKVRSIEKHVL
jgi:hypothetical protein